MSNHSDSDRAIGELDEALHSIESMARVAHPIVERTDKGDKWTSAMEGVIREIEHAARDVRPSNAHLRDRLSSPQPTPPEEDAPGEDAPLADVLEWEIRRKIDELREELADSTRESVREDTMNSIIYLQWVLGIVSEYQDESGTDTETGTCR